MILRIELNDDESVVSKIREGLKRTGGYCPCELERTADTRCMCKQFQEQNKPGSCHCGLFKKIYV